MAGWEDDDFGGFESADLDSVPVTPSASATINSAVGYNPITSPTEPGGGSMQVLDWILSNTPKADVSPTAVPHPVATSGNVSVPPFSLNLKDISDPSQTKDLSNMPSEEINRVETDASPFENDGWQVHAAGSVIAETTAMQETQPPSTTETDVTQDNLFTKNGLETGPVLEVKMSGSPDEPNMKPPSQSDTSSHSGQFLESMDAVKDLALEDTVLEKKIDNRALQDLQARLDAALVLKEYTERSVEKLREELKSLTEQRRKELSDRSLEHEKELEDIRNQHQEEMKELQKTSEDTVKLITKQYSEVWKLQEKEHQIETETAANSIVEKCVKILKQQQTAMSEKLKIDRLAQEEAMQMILKEEQEKMEDVLKKKVEEEKEKLRKELGQNLKDRLANEMRHLEESHASTLREAMADQQSHFEETLKSVLRHEGEKFSDTLKEAVRKTQQDSEKSFLERKKLEEKRNRNRAITMQLFLSSAMQQLEQGMSDERNLAEEIGGDESPST